MPEGLEWAPILPVPFDDPSRCADLARQFLAHRSNLAPLARLALVGPETLAAAPLSPAQRTSLVSRLVEAAHEGHAVAVDAITVLGNCRSLSKASVAALRALRDRNATDVSDPAYGQGGVEHDPALMVRVIDEALAKLARP